MCVCAFDLWTVAYVSGGRAIATAISLETRKRSPSVDPAAADTYLEQRRTPSRDRRDLLQREEGVKREESRLLSEPSFLFLGSGGARPLVPR